MARQQLALITGIKRDTATIEAELTGIDYEIQSHVCQSPEQTIRAVKGQDLIIDVGVPLPGTVIQEYF